MLARQLLLERASLAVPRALERVAGIQAQYAQSGYIGLWSRLSRFERVHLTSALERRSVVQATLMRSTIHLVAARDYPLFAEGVRRGRREWWLRVTRHEKTPAAMRAAAGRLRAALADAPRRRAELLGSLGLDSTTWNGLAVWVDLVRVPPSGTWEQRRADLYGLAEDWLGPWRATEGEGLERLVRRYLGGFGPSSAKEIAGWAGVAPAIVAPTLERLPLRRFRDEAGEELLDLPRALLPEPTVEAPVRFLPTWDATLLVHARRTQVLPEEYRPLVFDTKTPHSVPTFLVGGRVAGTWREERGRVQVEPFEPLPRAARRELEDEAGRLERFLA